MLFERHAKELLIKPGCTVNVGDAHGNVVQADRTEFGLFRRRLRSCDERGERSGELTARQAAAFEIADHSFNDSLHVSPPVNATGIIRERGCKRWRARVAYASSASVRINSHSLSTCSRSVSSAPIDTRTIHRPSRIAGVR